MQWKLPAATLSAAVLLAGCAHASANGGEPASSVRKRGGYDARLTGFDYPFPVEIFAFEAQRQPLEMAYMDVAPAEPNGRTVVLLHGKNFSGAYWAETIRSLQARGFRVVVPDQIGFGKSSKPERFQFTFQQLAENTRALLDRLGVERFAVVGHSMGGMLATRMALMYPERVEQLVLVNPIGLEDWKSKGAPYRTIDQAYAAELQATPEGVKAYMQEAYFAGQWKPAYDALTEIQQGWITGPDWPRVAWNAALTSDMVFTQPVVHEFPQVRVPTLLIIGQRDRTKLAGWAPPEVLEKLGDYPALGRAAAQAIPGARLVELEGIGHVPQVEAWDAYQAALLDFLGGDQASPPARVEILERSGRSNSVLL